jgi:hypothetical protein
VTDREVGAGVREKEVVGLVRVLRREKDRRAMEGLGIGKLGFLLGLIFEIRVLRPFKGRGKKKYGNW